MNDLALFFSIILISIGINGIFLLVSREKRVFDNTDIVRLPKIYFFAAIVCGAFFVIITIFLLRDAPLATRWILFIMIALTIWMIIGYLNWRIEIKEDEFVYQTVFRRRYTFYWDEVKIKRNTDNFIVISAAGRRFILDPHAIGIENFIHKVYHHRKRR